MARTRSLAYVGDAGASIPCFYQKIDPATGAPFDNTKITSVSLAGYDISDGSLVQASVSMTWDATLQGYRYNLAYSGAARRVAVVMTPTRAIGVSAALTPIDYETVDLADTLARIGKSTDAATDPSAASGTLFSKTRGTGIDTDAVFAELQAIEGTGWNAALDNLHQAKLARDSLTTQVSALDLRNSTALLLPPFMVKGKTYTIYLRIKDDAGQPVDADATPTLTLLEGTVTGITLSTWTRDSTGNYHATIAVDNAVPVDTTLSPRAAWTRTEGAVVNNEEATRYIVVDSFESDTSTILTNTNSIIGYLTNATYGLSALQVIAADIQAKVNNGTYGLAALRADIDAVAAQVGVDATATLQQKLGAFTAVLSLFALLGNFTATETVLKAVQGIQGMLN